MTPAAWLHLGNRAGDPVIYVPQGIVHTLHWSRVISVSPNWSEATGLRAGVLSPWLTSIVLPFAGPAETELFDCDFGEMEGTISEKTPRGIPSSLGDRNVGMVIAGDLNTTRLGQQIRAPEKGRAVLSLVRALDIDDFLPVQSVAWTVKHSAGPTPINVVANDLWIKYWEVPA